MGLFNQTPHSNFHDLNLDWIIQVVKDAKLMMENLPPNIAEKLLEIDELQNVTGELDQRVDVLEQFKRDFLDGKFIETELEAFSHWIDTNLTSLVARIVKFVFFYIDDDGFYCADIPDSWEFLHFDYIADQNSPNFGCLVIEY